MNRPVVLVLASGQGRRFVESGGSGSKLQALLAGVPVLQRTLDAARASGLPWHLESGPHPGMGDAIAAAVRATREAGGWLVLPGDLPLVRPRSLMLVAEALQRHAVVVPQFEGRRGHPVGFARQCMDDLLALAGEAGAAPVVKRWAAAGQCAWIDLDDPGIAADIDTIEDLARAERTLRGAP